MGRTCREIEEAQALLGFRTAPCDVEEIRGAPPGLHGRPRVQSCLRHDMDTNEVLSLMVRKPTEKVFGFRERQEGLDLGRGCSP